MTQFPLLTTGAVTQYPSSRNLTYSTYVTRFVDGREQRFRELKQPIRTWTLKLHRLSAEEVSSIELFFRGRQGEFGSFSFIDPWDGTEYPDCSFDQDVLAIAAIDESHYEGQLVIRNNTP